MHTSGDRRSWLQAVASKIMDGGESPPSMERLNLVVPPEVVTRMNDGYVTAAAALGETARQDYRAGWRIIIQEMIALLREQGFVGGDDQALTWMKPLDGEWKVAMPGEDRQLIVLVLGQRELRMSRDRMIIGERSEGKNSRIGVPSLFESGRMHPFELQVVGPRGGTTQQSFELHPLAMAIPPMTEAEREVLRASVERDGVKVPIVIYQKKILDGRNRSYFASAFKKPVRIEEFEGTEEEARRHVAILNLHRRHLTTAQRYLAADNLFGRQAEKEAAEAVGGRPRKDEQKPPLKTAEVFKLDRSGESHERAAKLAAEAGIPNISPAGMRAIKEVREAPETRAKIERGEIATVAEATAAARAEKKLPASPRTEGVEVISINKRLGRCVELLNTILTDCNLPAGAAPGSQISLRLIQIESLVGQVREALRARKIIS
jgi:hypothetical protein